MSHRVSVYVGCVVWLAYGLLCDSGDIHDEKFKGIGLIGLHGMGWCFGWAFFSSCFCLLLHLFSSSLSSFFPSFFLHPPFLLFFTFSFFFLLLVIDIHHAIWHLLHLGLCQWPWRLRDHAWLAGGTWTGIV